MTAIRTALVTGATDGIGLEIARLLTERGARVIGSGRRLPAPNDPRFAAAERWVHADQNDPEAAALALANVAGEGIDAAVLCAGTGTVVEPGGAEGAEMIRQTLRVNLDATLAIAHALAPALLERGGTLVLVGSVARGGAQRMPAYAASKAGLHGFARALGEEWRGRATVLALHPGPTRTAMHGKAGLDVGRARALFVSAPLMARVIVRGMERAHGTLRPAQRMAGHRAAAGAMVMGWFDR